MPPVLIPPPSGLGDLAVILRILDDKKELKAHLDEVLAAHKANEAIVSKVGKAEDIDRLHDEANLRVSNANQIKANAQDEAREIVGEAHRQASPVLAEAQAKLNEATRVLDESKAEARARNAKCFARENAVAGREDACTEAERVNESHAADLDRREAELNARDAATAQREAKLRAALA